MRPARLLPPAALLALLALAGGRAAADSASLDADLLKKVKAATVHFQVTLSDGRVAQGSGFFTDEPGLIVTNAHVVQMLDPESRKPTRVDVTLHGGTDKDRTLPAKVVGIDRGSDLALVRVDGKDLPAPLTFGTTKMLNETQSLFVFGFPFGRELGKEITVNRSSVSSLRRNGESVASIQLDGGLNPGNSGGPVVDGAGNVVGVAVSAVRGTNIGSAIPAEYVSRFVNGRIVGSSAEVPYKDGDRVLMEITFEMIDPLTRLKNVEFQLWAGNPGAPRPPGASEPAPLAGDSEKKRYKMPYAGKPSVTLAVPVPALTGRQVYWVQPIITNGTGETRWVVATVIPAKPALERRPVALAYKPPVDGRQTAEVVSNGDFLIRSGDGEEHSIGVNLTSAFTEAFAEEGARGFPARLTYDRFGMTIRVDGKPVEKDAELRRMQTAIRFAAADLEMDKDGGVGASKADLKRVPRPSLEMISDLSDQILQAVEVLSVPLPTKKVEALDTWKVRRTFLIGSAIVSVPVESDVTYRYMGVQSRGGKQGALVRLEGRVQGRKGDGLGVGGTVSGSAFVLTETGQVMSADARVKADVDLQFRGKQAKALATLAVSLKRPAPGPAPKAPGPK